MSKILSISISGMIIPGLNIFAVNTSYQNCTCPEFLLIDPIEISYLSWKYKGTNIIVTEIYPETDFVTDGSAPTFHYNTIFGYYLNTKCLDNTGKACYPQFRVLFSIPTFFFLIIQTILATSIYFILRHRSVGKSK